MFFSLFFFLYYILQGAQQNAGGASAKWTDEEIEMMHQESEKCIKLFLLNTL